MLELEKERLANQDPLADLLSNAETASTSSNVVVHQPSSSNQVGNTYCAKILNAKPG